VAANQSLLLSWANVQSIPARAMASIVAVLGFAGVAGILVVLLSLREGIRATYAPSGGEDVAIVRSGDSSWEAASFMPEDVVLPITRMPGIATTAAGPAVSRELVNTGVVRLYSKESSYPIANATARGMTPLGFEFRPGFHLVDGRLFQQGKLEVIVGRTLAREYGVTEGSEVRIASSKLTVAGIFTTNGGVADLEVWLDKRVMQGLMQGMMRAPSAANAPPMPDLSSTLRIRLAGPGSLDQLNSALLAEKSAAVSRLHIRAVTERAFLREQSADLIAGATKGASIVGLVMGAGALFGAINTMYAAVASRSREIATLRALGYASRPIAISVMTEALLLSLAGAAVGIALAALAIQRLTLSTFNLTGPVILHFTPTAAVAVVALSYALLLGGLSSLLPCVRALRAPIPEGLFAR
jgi:putative ABC transport system permease protein